VVSSAEDEQSLRQNKRARILPDRSELSTVASGAATQTERRQSSGQHVQENGWTASPIAGVVDRITSRHREWGLIGVRTVVIC